jgi:actin-related protein 5
MEEKINKLIFNINWDNKNPVYETRNFTGVSNNIQNDKNVGIVIDNGSYECRAGWSNCEQPNLRFKNFVAKPKVQNKNEPHVFFVGNEILSYEQGKLNKKSPFDKNLVTHFGTQEHILDYIFTNLKIEGSVNHPVVFSEPLCNLNWARKNLSEMFFELYSVPSLLYGVDSMLALQNNQNIDENTNCLLISSSYQTTHIVPIIKGRIVLEKVRRINIGGYHCNELMTKTLHLKYPDLRNKFTNEVIQEIQEKYTECAKNYHKQLKLLENVFICDQNKLREEEKIRMFGSLEMYEKAYSEELGLKRKNESKFKHLKAYRNFIDYENSLILEENEEVTRDLFFLEWPTGVSDIVLTDEEMRKKQDLRKEQSKRLREIMQKKREENLKAIEKELEELEAVSQLRDKDQYQFEEALLAKGYATYEELQKRINKIFIKINFNKEAREEERFDEEKRWPLLNIPDEDLSEEQIKMKRIQKMQRNAYLTRLEKREQVKKDKEKVEELKQQDPQNYLISLYKKKKELLDRIDNYKQIRKDLTNRHSKVNIRRMMVMASLGGDEKTKKKDNANDDFGINDEDWEVYRGISRHNLSEDEDEDQQQLNDIETQIIEMDPSYLKYNESLSDNVLSGKYLFLGIDQFRGPELLFQPYMIGVEQAGLTEIILSILKSMTFEEQKALAGNIFITVMF